MGFTGEDQEDGIENMNFKRERIDKVKNVNLWWISIECGMYRSGRD